MVRTFFDATFGVGGLRRLLACNATVALQVAAVQVPEFTIAIVVVNSPLYGGSGGGLAVYSLDQNAIQIAMHEMGHTAFGLADEYPYYAALNETGHDHYPSGEPSQPNVTTNTNANTLKWRWAVAPNTPIPTMSNPDCSQADERPSPVPAGTVGLFEGAHFYHCKAFRPQYDCKMRTLRAPFCVVCREVIGNRINSLTTMKARVRTPITVLARYPEHLDVFAIASDGRTMTNWWDQATGWAGWFKVQGGLSVAPSGVRWSPPVSAVARYSSHLDLFAVGTDHRVYSAAWDAASGWIGWFQIGNLVCRSGATVNVVSRYSDHIDLFTTASDGRIMSTYWNASTGWGDWFQVSGGVASPRSPVTAIARYPFRLDVFITGTDSRVHSVSWDESSGWSDWFPIGRLRCRPNSTISVVARFPDQLDLFTTASDGRIMSTYWNASTGWGDWFQVSGGVASPGSPVTAIARNSDHLDLFVIGTDRRIYSTSWHDTSGWGNWFNVSGGVGQSGGQVAAISRYPEHIDLFTVGADQLVQTTWWDGVTGWGGWFNLGVS